MVIFRFLQMYLTVLVYFSVTNFANGLLDSNHNEIDQCLLCARCNKPDHRGINETREFCTNPEALSGIEWRNGLDGDQKLKSGCFPHGDWCDVIGGINLGTNDNTLLSLLSIFPPMEGNSCYFNISYFDVSTDSENLHDTVFVTHNSSNLTSMHGKWSVQKDKGHYFEYYIVAKKGKFDFFY